MGKLKLLGYLAFAATLILSSCAKEDDDNSTDSRDKFVGSWLCKETHKPSATDTSTYTTPFTIAIAKGSGSTITISKFNNLGASVQVEALVSGSVMNINEQVKEGFTISGTGSYSNDRIDMSYKVDTESYTAVCTKN